MITIKQTLLIAGVCLLSYSSLNAASGAVCSGRTYILPSRLEGVRQPVMSLSGTWSFKYSPKSRWTTIQVPGEAAMQGFAIEHDKPFFYKKRHLPYLPTMRESKLFCASMVYTVMQS